MPVMIIRFDCGHEKEHVRPKGGISDHYGCDCVSCHPREIHKSPFKCKACGGNEIPYFTTCHYHPMSCCATDSGLDYICKRELRNGGYLPWHEIEGDRYHCFYSSGAFGQVKEDRICFSCKKNIDF